MDREREREGKKKRVSGDWLGCLFRGSLQDRHLRNNIFNGMQKVPIFFHHSYAGKIKCDFFLMQI